MFVDMPLEELRQYRPEVAEPADFDAFWAESMADLGELDPVFEPANTVIKSVDVYDVTFTGHGKVRVKAWLLVPKELEESTPVVVQFIGYSGGRARPQDWLEYSAAGFPHLVMDSRAQGGGWGGSDTFDSGEAGAPSVAGFMTKGAASPDDHYFTRIFVDAARAMQVPGAFSLLAGRRVVAAGGSQGGGLALAAAHLSNAAAAVMSDVPFLANFERAVAMTDQLPYFEITKYCSIYPERVEELFKTLSYIDVVNHAKRIHLPALFSVGLTDIVTPPSTVFSAYNFYKGPKDIEVYRFNGHEGGGSLHFEKKVAFLGRF